MEKARKLAKSSIVRKQTKPKPISFQEGNPLYPNFRRRSPKCSSFRHHWLGSSPHTKQEVYATANRSHHRFDHTHTPTHIPTHTITKNTLDQGQTVRRAQLTIIFQFSSSFFGGCSCQKNDITDGHTHSKKRAQCLHQTMLQARLQWPLNSI